MESEVQKLPSKKYEDIYLGGIGQGAMVVLAAYNHYHRFYNRLGGVVALLSYNIIEDGHINKASDFDKAKKLTPMFLYNGKIDEVIPIDFAEASFKYLKEEVYIPRTEKEKNETARLNQTQWETYPITQRVNPDLGHYYDDDMFVELQKFFEKVDL